MTPTERLRDLLPGLPIREHRDHSASVVLPDGSTVGANLAGEVYRCVDDRYLPVKIDDIETFRADLQSTATAWMDAICGPLADSELVDVADPNAHYTDGREVGPLRSFEISPRMKRTLSNMPDGAAIVLDGVVWTRLRDQDRLDIPPPDPARDADFRTLAVAIDRDPTTPMLAEMAAKYGEDDPDIKRCRLFVDFMEAE